MPCFYCVFEFLIITRKGYNVGIDIGSTASKTVVTGDKEMKFVLPTGWSSKEGRRALKDFYELMKLDPAPMKGENLYNVLYGTTFKFDRSKVPAEIDALTAKMKEEYAAGKNEGRKHRILITGCPMGGATMKVVKAIEENGGVVVAFENCSGAKSVDRLIDEYQVEAVVEMTLQAYHTHNVEAGKVGRFVREEKHIPYLHVETDYSQSDVGQLNTRIAALIEML